MPSPNSARPGISHLARNGFGVTPLGRHPTAAMDGMIVPMSRQKEPFDLPDLPEFLSLGWSLTTESNDLALTDAERSSLGPRASEKRKLDFAAGRVAARRALEGLGLRSAEILRGPGGEPRWPTGVVGSITHSSGLAMAVVGRIEETAGVGLDLEHRRPVRDIESFVAFGPEQTWVASVPALRDERLLEIFAAKEAIFKAVYPTVRAYFGFEAVSVSREGPQAFTATVVSDDLLAMAVPEIIEVPVRWADGMVLAWAVLPGP